MVDRLSGDSPPGAALADALKGWVMVALTLIFVILYAAALTGWLAPTPDEKVVARLEPIIFVIIGYYFGRTPAQQNEKTLKDEINRLTQKADAAQHARGQAQQYREALEEKLKNVRVTLASTLANASSAEAAAHNSEGGRHGTDTLRNSVILALEVLKS